MIDPNPRVKGDGVARLRKSGVAVTTGVLEEACRQLNEGYISVMTRGRPFVILKLAATLDGKIATASGDSQWVTGEAARQWAHRLRAESDAVLVGVNTVIRDDPELTVRRVPGRNPIRIILDGRLRIPLTASVLDPSKAPTRVATVRPVSSRKRRALEKRGAELLLLPRSERGKGRVDLRALLEALARRDVQRLLIEGGGEVAASALRAGVVDRVCWFQAPLILGGVDARCAVGGESPRRMAEALRLTHVRIRRVGEDWLIWGELLSREA
jgi:diaminohydroxyphosphoribosylaminopyrimidine deaminase/5-amino-6-(5-phosphoribosylamino)uracil reductase